MPKISVVVPVYNVEKYLSVCINSVLSQTFTDFELILVDDGSTDKGGDICDEYEKKDNRIRVIHQKNQGVSAARNAGIDLSIGEYLIFIDSDDTIDKNCLSILYKNLIIENADISLCAYKKIYNNGKTFSINDSNSNDNLSSIYVYTNRQAIEHFGMNNITYLFS